MSEECSIGICVDRSDRTQLENVLQHLELSTVQKQIIQTRYINMLEHVKKRVTHYSRIFYVSHLMITVGSLIVPALLSVQNSSSLPTDYSTRIYWTTFVISLLVTTCNAILALFKIDKKYYFLNTTLERLRTEGWQYVGLTGRYSGHLTTGMQPTHENQFVYFTHQIEKIKMKQVEEEYYKSDEKIANAPHGTTAINTLNGKNDLYPPSPDQPITRMATQHVVPEPIKETIQYMIQSQQETDTDVAPITPSNPLYVPPSQLNVKIDNEIKE